MAREREHGMLIPTATGPFHLAHFLIAFFIRRWSRLKCGTNIVLMDDYHARYGAENLRNPVGDLCPEDKRPAYEYWADHMLEDLNALGVGPSAPDELAAQGFDPSISVVYGSGFKELTDHYYKIWGYEKRWGPWPPAFPDGAMNCTDAIYLNAAAGIVHPYILIGWAIAEMSTGRTFTIDGVELTPLMGQLGEYTDSLERWTNGMWKAPTAYLMPMISYRRPDGSVTHLSSTDHTLPLREAIDAGITQMDLLQYLAANIIVPGQEHLLLTVDMFAIPAYMAAIKPDAVIDGEDWHRFIETGQVKKPRRRKAAQ